MTQFKMRYVHSYKDHHGKLRHYFRKGDAKRVPLPGEPLSQELMKAYEAARRAADARTIVGTNPDRRGSVSDVTTRYYRSASFVNLRNSTQSTYRGILERFRNDLGAVAAGPPRSSSATSAPGQKGRNTSSGEQPAKGAPGALPFCHRRGFD